MSHWGQLGSFPNLRHELYQNFLFTLWSAADLQIFSKDMVNQHGVTF